MEQVSLSCPRGTSISIEVAQYGNTVGGKSIGFDFIILYVCVCVSYCRCTGVRIPPDFHTYFIKSN